MIGLIIGVPIIFDPEAQGLYDIPKLCFMFGLSILGGLLFLIEQVKNKKFQFRWGILEILIILYLLANIISTFLSISPTLSIFGLYRRYDGINTLACYILIFFITANIDKPKSIIYAILIAGFISAFYGILQRFGVFIIPSGFGSERPCGFFGNPNFLSGYLLLVFPISLCLWLKEKRYIYGILSITIVLCILFTKTRGAFIGLIGELIFLSILFRRREIFYFLGIFLLIFLSFGIPVIKRLPSPDIARIGLWKGAFSVFLKHPVFGTGPECLNQAFAKNVPDEFVEEYKGAFVFADKAHNEFLDILATRGMVIFILWIFILAYVFKIGFFCKDKVWTIPILSSMVGYLIQAQFNLSYFSMTHLLWVMIGLIGGTMPKKTIKMKYIKILIFLSSLLTLISFWHIICFFLGDRMFHKAIISSNPTFYEHAIKLNKWEIEYKKQFAEFLLNSGKLDEAEKVLEKAFLVTDKEPKLWFLLARLNEEKNPSKAISFYEKTISLSPHWAEPYNNIAIIFAKKNDYKNAEYFFKKAFYLNKNSYKENLVLLYKQMLYSAYKERNQEELDVISKKLSLIEQEDSLNTEEECKIKLEEVNGY